MSRFNTLRSAARAIGALRSHGVTVKVLTGDNDLVTRKVCREVNLDPGDIFLGDKVETMTDDELATAAGRTHIFARLSPAHKQRIIRALQHKGHVVGFMGDGINDAPAMHVADVASPPIPQLISRRLPPPSSSSKGI